MFNWQLGVMFLILAVSALVMWEFYHILFYNFPPFFPTSKKAIKRILTEMEINPTATVYELGCGHVAFLREVEKNFPQAKLIGIDHSRPVIWLAKIKLLFLRSSIKVVRGNFLEMDLGSVDIIYCFLNNDTMKKLEPQVKTQCKQGTIVVSRWFVFPTLKAYKQIIEKKNNLYFYKI
jgi:hypothetical protein